MQASLLAPLADCFERGSNLRQLSVSAYSIAKAPAYAPCLQPGMLLQILERRVSIIFAMRQAYALIKYITLITEHKNVLHNSNRRTTADPAAAGSKRILTSRRII
ncbi:hypothetical protein DDIC_06635 [Desulfovibrio desulfuricans]|uniref:Uncharacterized protein n=1 Tax=Desulfovibrio desulfuricans TaxID=876 RepID=A0A4P7UHV2_DESDE|nr:hypothetical protein [Desulfovibrio desulfuricans]QCC85559.1 hypothetical protein DDIC_06635 [Desulfovibrio desulfuricans]